MTTAELNDTDLYQAPAADVVGQQGEFDNSSMFSPKGRAGRLRYFAYASGIGLLYGIIVAVVAATVGAITGDSKTAVEVTRVVSLTGDVFLLPITIIFSIKRLHDLEWTGWLSLLTLIPGLNILLGLILVFAPGNIGSNRYGPPPKRGSSAVAIIAAIMFLVAILGIIAAIAIPAYQDYVTRARQIQQHQHQ